MEVTDERVDRQLPKLRAEHLDTDEAIPAAVEQRRGEAIQLQDAFGVPAWPVVPRGVDWKHGVCRALGWPHTQQADIARAWQRVRGRVRDLNDLEPALIGRVEELIDFVTAPLS